MKKVFTMLALAAVACSSLAAVKVGSPAPDFTGTDLDGKQHKLSDYKGKVVVLESLNPDCPYVKNHYSSGAMPELQKELRDKGVVWLQVVSIPKDNSGYRDVEKAKAEAAKGNATAWIDDNDAAIGKAYGMRTTPHMFVIDKEGVLAYQGAVDDSPVPKGDPRKARNYVREAVQKVQAGEKVEVTETKPYGCGVKF